MTATHAMAVLMAKMPRPGAVKTRLTEAGDLSEADAAAVAEAMLIATARRLRERFALILAVSPDDAADDAQRLLNLPPSSVCGQGGGDLGRRLERIWCELGRDRPVMFFGADAPDAPDAALAMIPSRLTEADVVIGPSDDGGYWTIGGARPQPAVLRDIDWGGAAVYDQTLIRAGRAGLAVSVLPQWPDVDRPEDLAALRRRLGERLRRRGARTSTAAGDALDDLAARLRALGASDDSSRAMNKGSSP